MRKFPEIENSGLAYVYEHWRPDLNLPFWVGKGTTFRYRVYKRNPHYNNVAAKLRTLGLKIEVRFVAINLTEAEAYRIEVERLEFWKSQGVDLTNKSAGGLGGMAGIKRSPESRSKQGATTKGRKLSPEHIQAIRAFQSTPEYKAKISSIHKGRKRPPETGERISAAMRAIGHRPIIMTTGRKASEEAKAKLRAANTPEVRARKSAATRNQWADPDFRKLVSDTMKRTNAARAAARSTNA